MEEIPPTVSSPSAVQGMAASSSTSAKKRFCSGFQKVCTELVNEGDVQRECGKEYVSWKREDAGMAHTNTQKCPEHGFEKASVQKEQKKSKTGDADRFSRAINAFFKKLPPGITVSVYAQGFDGDPNRCYTRLEVTGAAVGELYTYIYVYMLSCVRC